MFAKSGVVLRQYRDRYREEGVCAIICPSRKHGRDIKSREITDECYGSIVTG